MGELGAVNLIVIGLALLWVGIAVAIAITGARRFRLAQDILDIATTHARLLELAPARPLLVRTDLRVEIDPQLQRDLGLERPPKVLDDLSAGERGIDAEDLAKLAA